MAQKFGKGFVPKSVYTKILKLHPIFLTIQNSTFPHASDGLEKFIMTKNLTKGGFIFKLKSETISVQVMRQHHILALQHMIIRIFIP